MGVTVQLYLSRWMCKDVFQTDAPISVQKMCKLFLISAEKSIFFMIMVWLGLGTDTA